MKCICRVCGAISMTIACLIALAAIPFMLFYQLCQEKCRDQ